MNSRVLKYSIVHLGLDFVDVKDMMKLKAMSKAWPKDLRTTILLLPQYPSNTALISAFRKLQASKIANLLKLLNLNIVFSTLVRDTNLVPLMSTNVKLCPPVNYIFLLQFPVSYIDLYINQRLGTVHV